MLLWRPETAARAGRARHKAAVSGAATRRGDSDRLHFVVGAGALRRLEQLTADLVGNGHRGERVEVLETEDGEASAWKREIGRAHV